MGYHDVMNAIKANAVNELVNELLEENKQLQIKLEKTKEALESAESTLRVSDSFDNLLALIREALKEVNNEGA